MEGTPDLLYSPDWDFGSILPLGVHCIGRYGGMQICGKC